MVVILFCSSGPALIHAVEKGQIYLIPCLFGLYGIKLLPDYAKQYAYIIHYDGRNFIESIWGIEINHPPYSQDLAPCDYWLFDYIKQRLGDEQNEKSLKKSIKKNVEMILDQE